MQTVTIHVKKTSTKVDGHVVVHVDAHIHSSHIAHFQIHEQCALHTKHKKQKKTQKKHISIWHKQTKKNTKIKIQNLDVHVGCHFYSYNLPLMAQAVHCSGI